LYLPNNETLTLEATMPSDQRPLAGLATGITIADNPFEVPERTVDENGLLTWHPPMLLHSGITRITISRLPYRLIRKLA
tara:strand:- start:7 stop:243 length:237 start_codon:yes stop_codon:yes gene_type:complete